MRRLIVLLLFLIVAGAVVFYFGWIQIKLDEDSYAVIFTKTGGWEETAIAPGDFTWRAARLLPTNLSLHIIPIQPRLLTASIRGTLPSAQVYGALVDGAAAFGYAVSVEIVYSINPEALPGLVRDADLREEGLSDYYQRTDAAMEQIASQQALRLLNAPERLLQPAAAFEALSESLTEALERQYPGFVIHSVTPTRIDLPDIDLYVQARDRYLQVLDERTAALAQAAREMADSQTAADAGLARLERYGEILERYPILLEYFTLSQDSGGDPLDLESLIPQPGT